MAVLTTSVAGIVAGRNPLEYSASSPYTIFLFQAVFIILLCQLVNYPLKRLQQPRVIAEVVSGILLGPTVMGRIPNFSNTCFPKASLPGLSLMANVGIILFLFIIGLEVDITFIKKNLRASLTVGMINMAIPFGLGCAIAKGIYDEYHLSDDTLPDIKFTTYMVFIAVALCITAFPVLARILTELNLIGDRVGTIVLAAGITNDLVGWILLALVVTLANASNGLNTLYILLVAAGWFLFLCYPVRLSMRFLLKKFTSDLQTGEPSQVLMLLIIVLVFISAFFTDIIGVHPIFGAFMVGVIVPRDNGYVIKITEKLEDLVNVVLIPLYFANAGLSTNLGLLNRGIDWGYTIGIILLAMVGKIVGGFFALRLNKLLWRESLAVGVLMSCKGIVEIVVLSVGLNAGIISQKVYSMFIVMALITTFATTPLALLVYPVEYREKRDKFINGEINWDGTPIAKSKNAASQSIDSSLHSLETTSLNSMSIETISKFQVSKLVVLVKSLNTISNLMHFVHDFASMSKTENDNNYKVDVKALHLREFTSRTSHLLEVSAQKSEDPLTDESNSSSILSILRIFTEMLNVHFTSLSILSPNKNHVFSINEQILESSSLLIGSHSIKLALPEDELNNFFVENNVNSEESSDFSLYKKLFHSCKCHFGLLLSNEGVTSENEKSYLDEADASTLHKHDSSGQLFGRKAINLVLNHDSVLSASDLLALHVTFKLGFNSAQVNIFVQSSITTAPRGFDQQIEKLIHYNSGIDLVIHHIKESVNFTDEIVKYRPQISLELLIVANNIGREESTLFDKNVTQIVDMSVLEGVDVLIVKAFQSN